MMKFNDQDRQCHAERSEELRLAALCMTYQSLTFPPMGQPPRWHELTSHGHRATVGAVLVAAHTHPSTYAGFRYRFWL